MFQLSRFTGSAENELGYGIHNLFWLLPDGAKENVWAYEGGNNMR
jgi:hypothetical protein